MPFILQRRHGILSVKGRSRTASAKVFFYEPLVVADSTDDVPAPANMTEEEFEDFVDMDSDLPRAGELSDAELLEAGQQRRVDAEEMDDDEEEPQVLSIAQKMQMINYFRQIIQETGMQTAINTCVQ